MGTSYDPANDEPRKASEWLVALNEAPDSRERVLSLTIRRPIINHEYVLLYEPAS